MYRALTIIAATLLLAGCATTPKPLQGEFSRITPAQARNDAGTGEQVRWGGEIVSAQPMEDRTCLEVLSRYLGKSGRPSGEEDDQGRFIACKQGFLDPATFDAGRQVTVIGRIEDVETRKIGEYDYRYPKLDANVVYLWPEREANTRHHYHYHDPFFYDPFYWPHPYSIWYRHPGHWPKASGTGGKTAGD